MNYYIERLIILLCFSLCSTLVVATNKASRTAVLKALTEGNHTIDPNATPLVTIITSVYKGDRYIETFLRDIVRQTIFHQCELLIVNANSPENEEPIILEYCKKYPNIHYERFEKDPGLYGVWNYLIKKARGQYITNANIDDLRNPRGIEHHVLFLNQHPTIDLVYSPFFISETPHLTFEMAVLQKCFILSKSEFSFRVLHECLPGPFPTWRKSLHEKYGYFNEKYKSAGDWEFWNKIVVMGAKFKKDSRIVSGVFYNHLASLSHQKIADQEYLEIYARYCYLWQ